MCSRPRRSMTRSMTDCGMDSVCIEASARRIGMRLSYRARRRATVPLARKSVRDEGMGKRVAMAGGGLVVYGHANRVGLRVGKGMVYVAEREQRPARFGLRHLGLEGVALGLGRDRVSGAVHGKDRGFDIAALGGLRRRQRPVHGY